MLADQTKTEMDIAMVHFSEENITILRDMTLAAMWSALQGNWQWKYTMLQEWPIHFHLLCSSVHLISKHASISKSQGLLPVEMSINFNKDTMFILIHKEDIKNNAWVTVNNDFLVTSGVICQWFSRVTKSRVKIIGKSPHEWPKNRYSR